MELKFVNNCYLKQLFQNLRPKLKYSKNRIFVTSHFGTLLRGREPMACVPDVGLLMNTTGSLAHRKLVPDIFSFATKHVLSKVTESRRSKGFTAVSRRKVS